MDKRPQDALYDPQGSADPEDEVRALPAQGHVFLGALSWQDLQRLRAAVKRVYLRHYPSEHCTDREADRMIEALGPGVAERLVKAQVDVKLERKDGRIDYGRLRLDE